MKSKIRELQIFFQKGELNNAKNLCENILENNNINDAQIYNIYANILYKLNNFELSIENWNKSLKIDSNLIDPYKGLANSFLKLEKFEEAIKNFDQLIKTNPNFGEAYHGKAFALMQISKFDESINNFKIAIKINPHNPDIYNMLGTAYFNQEKWEEACDHFIKALELSNDHNLARENLINLLTFYQPKKTFINTIIKTNNLLKENIFDFKYENKISDYHVTNYFSKIYKIIIKNMQNNLFNSEQIFRRNKLNLDCERHFRVFNTFNVIPKYCFSCYKIQIEPKNVIDLFKLFVLFDNLELENNNIRKCIIESRPKVSGTYKGLIYCNGVDEVKTIFHKISLLIKKSFGYHLPIFMKRGCTEFSVPYPKFKEIDKSMEYDENWSKFEKEIDQKNNPINKKKSSENTLRGTSISDVLIMRNWLAYAKKIDDCCYKKFNIDIPEINYINEKLKGQIEFRKKEFHKTKSI